jgi:hypothetical protein
MCRKGAIAFFLALALQAQESGGGNKTQDVRPAVCDATDWKARAENLEQQIAALTDQLSAMGTFYTAKDKFTAIKAQEPPKPPEKPQGAQ